MVASVGMANRVCQTLTRARGRAGTEFGNAAARGPQKSIEHECSVLIGHLEHIPGQESVSGKVVAVMLLTSFGHAATCNHAPTVIKCENTR